MTRAPGVWLAGTTALIVTASLSPAGLGGTPIPPWSWAVWAVAACGALGFSARAPIGRRDAWRRILWLWPIVALFVLPAAWVAPPGTRGVTAAALLTRAWSAAALGAGLAMWLGPHGLIAALRQWRVNERLVDIVDAMLVSLATITRQVHHMLRAREARRPGPGAWRMLLADPVDTIRGFGRLVASLLLRSLERAEALERARRARGGVA